jgi:hypothetical protein
MVGPSVYIKCRKKVTELMVKIFPGLKRYIRSNGLLYFELLKAVYGCVQASKLWFKKLTKVLRHEGYDHSPTDPCIMRWIVRDKIFLLLIYVDDIRIFADEADLKHIVSFLRRSMDYK